MVSVNPPNAVILKENKDDGTRTWFEFFRGGTKVENLKKNLNEVSRKYQSQKLSDKKEYIKNMETILKDKILKIPENKRSISQINFMKKFN